MSKFGELIDVDIPVLLDFFTEGNDQSTAMHPVLRDVAAALGDKAKIIKIDVDKNQELSVTYDVRSIPTVMIFQNSELKWRQTGSQTIQVLKSEIDKLLASDSSQEEEE